MLDLKNFKKIEDPSRSAPYFSFKFKAFEICLEPCLNGFCVAIYKDEELVEDKKCTDMSVCDKHVDVEALLLAQEFYEKYGSFDFFVWLDSAYRALTEKIIMFGVRKSKFKKHKFDVLVQLWGFYTGFSISIIFIALPVASTLQGNSVWMTGFLVIMWSLQIIWGLIKSKEAFEMARVYDFAFHNRKQGNMWIHHQKFIQDLWRISKPLRVSVIKAITIVDGVFVAFMVLLNSLVGWHPTDVVLLVFAVQIPLWMVDRYAIYVDDFGDPPKRKKRQKDSLTDLAKKAWETLVKNPLPNPV